MDTLPRYPVTAFSESITFEDWEPIPTVFRLAVWMFVIGWCATILSVVMVPLRFGIPLWTFRP